MAAIPGDGRFAIEHPTAAAEICFYIAPDCTVRGAGTIRTARKLMEGRVFPRPT